jgi:sodium/proline symporter
MNTFALPITFVVYLAVIALIAYIASYSNRRLSDYFLANRALSAPIVALGAGASDMSAWLLLALPGLVFTAGLSAIYLPIGLLIGAYCNWRFVARRLRVYTEVLNAITIPAYFKHRFKSSSPALGIVTAVVVVIFFTTYTAAGLVSGAWLLNILFPAITYHEGIAAMAAIIIAYITLGGFLATSWIDFLQGTLMFFALLIVPIMTLLHLGHAHTPHLQTLEVALRHAHFWLAGMLITTISLLSWGIGYFGQPHILVRFMAIKKPSGLSLARKICMSWMTASLIGAIMAGFLGALYFHHHLTHPATVFLHLATQLFNPWVTGFLMTGVLSAVMSATSAQLLVASSAVTEDFYHVLRPKARNKELILVSRATIILMGLLACGLAFNPHASILGLVSYAWSGIGAVFGPAILLSLYWKRCTEKAILTGMVCGALTVILWHTLGYLSSNLSQMIGLLPGFVVNTLAILIISKWGDLPSGETLKQHRKMEQQLKSPHTSF